MTVLGNLANRLAKGFENVALDVVAGIPRTGTERDMRKAHDAWLQTMQLGRTYYAWDARYYWVATDMNGAGDARLVLRSGYTFVRRDHNGAYTENGTYSWNAWFRSGLDGLTFPEPEKPAKGRDFYLEADLRDAAHPERWEITYK